jgi:hypothetical protein
MKKTIITLLLLVFAFGAFAQDKYSKINNPVREDGLNVIENYIRTIYPPVLISPASYPGEIPGTSNFWDYQTNGSSLNGLMVFGDTILVCYPAVDSIDPTGATTRVGYLVISTNGGLTWDVPLPLQFLPNRSGYPELRKVTLTGNIASVVLSGRKYSGSNARGGAWIDAYFGLGGFSSSLVPEAGRDYFGDLISGNKYGGLFSTSSTPDSMNFIKYDYNSNSMGGKVTLTVGPNFLNTNTRYRFASNGGNNLFAVWYDNTTAAYALRYTTSTDGGTTWSSIASLQTAFGLYGVVNGDTCSPWFGIDAAYKPGTTQWVTVWSTLYPTATGQSSGDPQGCKILFESPNINGGAPVQVAGKINMTIISDTNQFFNIASGGLQVGVTPVSHPTIAYSSDGSRVVVAFSAFQPGDSLDGFTYNDIYVTYSDNGGLNWINPVKLTNTPTWDELYPVLSETGNTPNQFTIKYQVTKGPGSQSFTDLTPTYRVYHVLRRFNPANVGIKEISGNVPDGYSLAQNYPNPFNPTTTIRFEVPKSGFVTLKVYDITGKMIETLVSENLKAGTKEVIFDAANLPSGVYFYSMISGSFKETRKMILVK